jgi:hypothetical protein
MAMERSSSLDLESLKEGGGDHWPGEWEGEMVLAIAGPSPSCSRCHVICSFVKIEWIWQGKLPYHYGPRFTLVTITGDVILLDGRLNIKPTQAVTILNASKGSVVRFSYEDVLQALKVSAAVLVEKAHFGSWWISNKPSLDGSGNLALIPAGGKTLVVDARQAKIYIKP